MNAVLEIINEYKKLKDIAIKMKERLENGYDDDLTFLSEEEIRIIKFIAKEKIEMEKPRLG